MNCLLILDRAGYKIKEDIYKEILSENYTKVEILYTRYEDDIIRTVRNWPMCGNFLQHFFRWIKSLKYTIKILRKKEIDRIICLNPIVGVMLGLFNFNKHEIYIAGFLFENKSSKIYFELRKLITQFALKNLKKVIVYGSKEVEYYETLFRVKNKFKFIPYGIDYLNQTEYLGTLPQEYIFSGGGSNRDYRTLCDAIERVDRTADYVVATQPWRLNNCKKDKIQLLTDVVNETFGDVLKKSQLLVLSLKETNISAGHMVMLQAMSLGVPILVNDIPAIRDYADDSVVSFYKSGDVEELSNILQDYKVGDKLIQKKCMLAKKLYWSQYTSESLIRRLSNL